MRRTSFTARRPGSRCSFAQAALVALLTASSAGATRAGEPLATSFGMGAHAYFAGDYARSYDDLTAAIEAGSQDPRAWYFRGLAALRLGRLDEAEADFSTGALQETRGLGTWGVSRSLERIQGHDRLQLERHRIRARMAALQAREQAIRRRYVEIEDAEPGVLRKVRPVEPGAGGKDDPFADQPEKAPAAGAKPALEAEDVPPPSTPKEPGLDDPAPAGKPPMKSDDPFGDPPAPAEPKADDAKPAEAGKPAAEAADDPFGDKPAAPAEKPAEPAAGEKPAEAEPGLPELPGL